MIVKKARYLDTTLVSAVKADSSTTTSTTSLAFQGVLLDLMSFPPSREETMLRTLRGLYAMLGEVHLEMIGLHYIQLNLIPQSTPGRCRTPTHATYSWPTKAGMILAGLEERKADLLS